MVTRGAAPSAVCPRCGTETPPSDTRLVTCAACKLSFDPRSAPAERPLRRASPGVELQPAPPGFVIAREPGEVTMRWSFERLKGIGALVLAALCAAVLIGNLSTPGEDWKNLAIFAIATLGLGYVGLALAFGETVLRIDERQLLLRREPLRLGRTIWIGRSEIQDIVTPAPHTVVVVTPRGRITLVDFDDANHGARDAATCVAEVVRESIVEIPAV